MSFVADICGEASEEETPPKHAHAFGDVGRLHKQDPMKSALPSPGWPSQRGGGENFPHDHTNIGRLHSGEKEKFLEALINGHLHTSKVVRYQRITRRLLSRSTPCQTDIEEEDVRRLRSRMIKTHCSHFTRQRGFLQPMVSALTRNSIWQDGIVIDNVIDHQAALIFGRARPCRLLSALTQDLPDRGRDGAIYSCLDNETLRS